MPFAQGGAELAGSGRRQAPRAVTVTTDTASRITALTSIAKLLRRPTSVAAFSSCGQRQQQVAEPVASGIESISLYEKMRSSERAQRHGFEICVLIVARHLVVIKMARHLPFFGIPGNYALHPIPER